MKRQILIIGLFLALVFTFTAFASAQDAGVEGVDSYIVVLKPDIQAAGAVQPNAGLNANAASVLAAGASPAQIVNEYKYAFNGYSALLTEQQAKDVGAQKGVFLVLEDQWRYPDTDSSPAFLGLTGRNGAWAEGYDGEGVIVGVIDSGIWPEHPSFADDGSFPPAPPLDNSRPNCDFGNTAHNPDDAPFTCNNKLIGARQMLDTYRSVIGADPDEYDSARDDDGHGTHTASTAAGNADVEASIYDIRRETISGIAPRAHVIAYKGLGNLGGFSSDLAAAIDQAVADGVDVINYSVGGGAGLTGADELAFLFAEDAGIFSATSAGNSGPFPGTVGGPGTVPWITTVGASTQERFFQGEAKTHGPGGDKYIGASITPGTRYYPLVDAEDAGNPSSTPEFCIPGALDPAVVEGKIVLCRRGAIARAAKSLAVYQAGGVGMILYNNSDDDNLFTDSHWVPSVHIDNTPGLEIKAYIDNSSNPKAKIKVNSHKNGEWDSAPSMTIFSSRGPDTVAPDIIKPDVTAPGMQILAGYSPTPDPLSDYPGQLFAAIAGTSMSSPHVAGLGALMVQAHPDWTPAMIKSALMTTAYQDVVDNDRLSPADPFDMGAGHVKPGERQHDWWWGKHSAETTNYFGVPWFSGGLKNTSFEPGLVYDAGLFEYAAFTCGMELGIFTPGSCVFLKSIGVPSDPSDLNLASIGIAELAGSQTVQRTVTAVFDGGHYSRHGKFFSAKVDAPDGYDVTVSPKWMWLKDGETATYEVTISNDGSGPVGEWRFGSLTWKGSGYSVRSPIAVKGALFDSPDEVAGTGTIGSTSFDVLFGYTGSYAAAPHGLVPDDPTSGEIGQDPDQTYPSGDDSPIGVQKITYPITGAAFVRWELVIPGPDDIDLFLEDSTGTIVAASTNGGTDELIELTLPADDTYTMVVHGWSVPNEPLPYTLHYWEVPLASGGSLSVDSAPASAVVGEVGTIDLSWTLAFTETQPYLGAVSHTGDVGLMGLTLVEVDASTSAPGPQ